MGAPWLPRTAPRHQPGPLQRRVTLDGHGPAGTSAASAIHALLTDADIAVVVVVARPTSLDAARQLADAGRTAQKPVVLALLDFNPDFRLLNRGNSKLSQSSSLEAVAARAVLLAGVAS